MKPYLALIIISIIFLFSCDKEDISNDQHKSFVKYYTNYPEFFSADVALTEDGYAILGTAKTDNKTYICLLRLDEFGNSIDTARLYGTSDKNTAYCLKTLSDGGFGILGSTLVPETNKLAAYFIRTNSVGDVLWTRTIKRTGNLVATCFETGPDESFFMTGSCDSAGMGKQIWWFGIDNQGQNIRSQRSMGFEFDDAGTHIQVLADGGLVIAGHVTRSSISRMVVIKTHPNTVYAEPFEMDADVNESATTIRVLDADNFLLLGNRQTASASEIVLKRIVMSDRTVLWTKEYSASNINIAKSMILDNQTYYILGTTGATAINTSISLFTTDNQGNETNVHAFGPGGKLSASAFKQTADNGFIITGTNIHDEANNTSITLIKTGADTGL